MWRVRTDNPLIPLYHARHRLQTVWQAGGVWSGTWPLVRRATSGLTGGIQSGKPRLVWPARGAYIHDMPQQPFTPDDFATLGYLGLLAVFLGATYLAHTRLRLHQVVQQAAIWCFIFIGAIAAVGLWEDVRNNTTPPRQSMSVDKRLISVPRARDGHYYLVLAVNGAPIRFVVDTGASDLVLTRQDAARAGVDPDTLVFAGRARTANGSVRTAMVTLDTVSLPPVVQYGVGAVVNAGDMDVSLLGMSYLERFGRIEIARGVLSLRY